MARRAGFSTGVGGAAPVPQATLAGLPQGVGRGYGVRQHIDGMVMERLLSPRYFTHFERFENIPRVVTSTSHIINTAFAEEEVQGGFSANQQVAVDGNSADDGGITFLEGGGIRMQTAGADLDEHILVGMPVIDTTHLAGALTAINWDSRNRMLFMANMVTGPLALDVNADTELLFGWKLTTTVDDVDDTTDADQAMFWFDGTDSQNWQAVTSVNGVDRATDTGIAVVLATNYRLVIDIDAERVPRYFINDVLVDTGPAIRALNTFDFALAVTVTGATAAPAVDIRNFLVSQLYG